MDQNQDIEDSPVKTKGRWTRKKVPDPVNWEKNVRKKLYNSGAEYVTSRGKLRRSRQVQPKDCSSCRKNCNVSFSEKERQKIHTSFWALGDPDRRRRFVASLIEEEPASKRKSNQGRRAHTRSYYLRCGNVKLPVCKGFFLATLDISEGIVNNLLKKRAPTEDKKDTRQPRKEPRERPKRQEDKEAIRTHIRSFIDPAALEGTQVQEVAGGMTIEKMYKQYSAECERNGVKPEKIRVYRRICDTEFNLHFVRDPSEDRDDEEMFEETLYLSESENAEDAEQIMYEEEVIAEESSDG